MKALVLLANGTEEMEAVITCDILARAGIHVFRAAVNEDYDSNNLVLKCANGMKLLADIRIQDVMSHLDDYAIIVLPGGSKGAQTFCSNDFVQNALKHFAGKQFVAAICAAPLALRQAEIFHGAHLTCYPSLENETIRDNFFIHDQSKDTIHDGRLITSRGPGTAMDFALTIVKVLKGDLVRKNVAAGLLLN